MAQRVQIKRASRSPVPTSSCEEFPHCKILREEFPHCEILREGFPSREILRNLKF
jgi:hypothetical protein